VILDVVGAVLLATGLAITSVGVYGVLRLRGLYVRLHAAGMATGPGAITVLLASVATSGQTTARALLIAFLLLLTAPLSSHAIARAARLVERRDRGEEI
jgi:multicomponent Na+:H+ antiporter subunit G